MRKYQETCDQSDQSDQRYTQAPAPPPFGRLCRFGRTSTEQRRRLDSRACSAPRRRSLMARKAGCRRIVGVEIDEICTAEKLGAVGMLSPDGHLEHLRVVSDADATT